MTDEQLKAVVAGEFTLDVPNFSKWNPERKHRAYFTVSIHWDDDPRVRCLAPSTRLLFITCLKLRATSSGPLADLTATYIRARSYLNGTSVEPMLVKLAKSGLIVLECTSLEGGKEGRKGDDTPTPCVEQSSILPEIETSIASEYLKKIPLEKQKALVTQYGAERVKNAAMDAAEWCRSKGKRGEKKSWGLFLGNWLKNNERAAVAPKEPKQQLTNEMFEGVWK